MMNNVVNIEEVWKVIDHPSIGCYDGYMISSLGRVKSLNYRGNTGKEQILKQTKDKDGYLLVGLYKKGKQKRFRVHRLVAEAFIPNPDNLPVINHRDEDKTNNRFENLEWCTQKFNRCYGTAIQRMKETIKNSIVFKEANRKRGKKMNKQVYQYDQNLNLLKIYESLKDASKHSNCDCGNISQGNISACCLGKRKTAYGYIWSYEPLPNANNQLTLFLFSEWNVSFTVRRK